MTVAYALYDWTGPPFGLGIMLVSVLGQLDVWDLNGCKLPVYVRASSGTNLCLDPLAGPNVWDYWFEQPSGVYPPLEFVGMPHQPRWTLSGHSKWDLEARARIRHIASKYVRVKDDVIKEVNAFCAGFNPGTTLAVQLRGTDKHEEAFRYGEAKRVPDVEVLRRVEELRAETALSDVYGMTDDTAYADLLRSLGAHVRDIPRGAPDGANLLQQRPGVQTGRDSLIDALVAARCAAFAHTPTNMASVVNAFGSFDEEFVIHPFEPWTGPRR